MITGAIFDVDGVLLDTMPIWNDLGGRYLQRLGVQPEPGLNEILFSMSMEQGAAYMREAYALPQSEAEILQGIEAMLQDFYYYEAGAKPGAAELLIFLEENQIPMALATSSPRGHIARALERSGILHFFGDRLFTTGEVGTSKHEPDIYCLAAESLCSLPEHTLVFEDSLYALITARKAGFCAVGVLDKNGETNQRGMRQTADLYIESLDGFAPHWSEIKSR